MTKECVCPLVETGSWAGQGVVGQLTDDDLDRIEGESEKLIGALQTRYGWSREQAEQDIERRMGRAA